MWITGWADIKAVTIVAISYGPYHMGDNIYYGPYLGCPPESFLVIISVGSTRLIFSGLIEILISHNIKKKLEVSGLVLTIKF